MNVRTLIVASSALATAGCATSASSVAPAVIAASTYSSLSCEETSAKLQAAKDQEKALERKQNNAAAADAASVALILVPISLFRPDASKDLAQTKGEVLALQQASAQTCPSDTPNVSPTAALSSAAPTSAASPAT